MTLTNEEPNWSNTFHGLPRILYSAQLPHPVKKPHAIVLNEQLAKTLGISTRWLNSSQGLYALSGNSISGDSKPVALAYAGHQFGMWSPQLGDGRAVLLGELNGSDGNIYDVQLKGSGDTPYSRMGDGRAPLKAVLREYLVSEAMAALKVPTTRSLAAIATGERIARNRLEPSGILARSAQSHIRIGTFEYLARQNKTLELKRLSDFVIERLFSDCKKNHNPYQAMFIEVLKRQAQLIAKWQALGFVHGVMNTDNMLLSGETIDYGPCAFLDSYDPKAVYSAIDKHGRYAFSNQPYIALWNLERLGESLLPLLAPSNVRALKFLDTSLADFESIFNQHYNLQMAQKLGFHTSSPQVKSLIDTFLSVMKRLNLDYHCSFSQLSRHLTGTNTEIFSPPVPATETWISHWRHQLTHYYRTFDRPISIMAQNNPLYIPRNHLVEAAVDKAIYERELSPFYELLRRVTQPLIKQVDHLAYFSPPTPDKKITETHCGT